MNNSTASSLPLAGLRVVEFTHMVMGPTVGSILAELGADVVKIEPPGGDLTRELLGSGAGYFPMYNRGKRSICLNLKQPQGQVVARGLASRADILVENFRAGVLDRLGLSYEVLSESNPRLIYCSEKGFLAGPYEKRTALDEVAQMMGGLAYMTGPPGRPLRAGASVVDVTGGMFGVIAILAALESRHSSGRGQKVQSALFETTVYLVGQHMAQMAVTGRAAQPMPARISAWAIYDVFETRDAKQVFVGVVSDAQWLTFCTAFELAGLAANPEYRTNRQRVLAREVLLPLVRSRLMTFELARLIELLDGSGLPFAPIGRPEDLFLDPHLLAGNGLAATTLPDGRITRLPTLPIELSGQRPSSNGRLPAIGEHTDEILRELGMAEESIRQFTDEEHP